MQTDLNLIFSNLQTITATAGSTNIYDIAEGVMVTTTYDITPPGFSIGIGSTFFGEDLGTGWKRMYLAIFVGTVFATLTSLTIAFQGAPEDGSGNTSSLVWVTYAQSGAIPVARLTAGASLTMPDLPAKELALAQPRFYRLLFTVGGSNATTGTIYAAIVSARPDLSVGKYNSGFTVSA